MGRENSPLPTAQASLCKGVFDGRRWVWLALGFMVLFPGLLSEPSPVTRIQEIRDGW